MAYSTDKAYELLAAAHERNRLAHALLIHSTNQQEAKELVKRLLNLLFPPAKNSGMDLFGENVPPESREIDDFLGEGVTLLSPEKKSRIIDVKSIRSLERHLHQSSNSGGWRVGVIIDADRLGSVSANAFLKTLEEPPDKCLIILITQSPERLLPTILSRCLQLTLLSESKRELYAGEDDILRQLSLIFKNQSFGSINKALEVKASFSKIMSLRKKEITRIHDLTKKEENLKYKKSTDGEWLKGRDDHFKALISSDYLLERNRLVEVYISWIGDVIRIKNGLNDHLEYPKSITIYEKIAATESLESLMLRFSSLNKLHRMLETNVSEQLALEVSFINAFG